jgi:predicted NBD/HSP70 family sugar kinase
MRTINPTTRDLRRMNRRTILQAIYEAEAISRLELSQRCGLSTGTVTNVVADLLTEEVVREAGFEASEGGRRRTILTLNRHYGYFIGAEVGESEIVLELFDLTLHKVGSVTYHPTYEENTPERAVEYIVEGIWRLLMEARIAPEKVLGIGLAVPGIVERTERELVFAPCWGWQPVALKEMLGAHVDFPLYLENGSKTIALAEVQRIPNRQRETVAVVNLGTGVGAGIIYEGKLYRGATNSAGEWGHTIMALNGKLCRCGRQGCLEAYIGAPGIIDRFRALAPESPLLQSREEMQVIKALTNAALYREPHALQVFSETAHYLGAGLANLINLFNPQRVILSGWVGIQLGAYLLPDVLHYVEGYALKQPYEATQIVVGQLGMDAGSIGAVMLALENFLTNVVQ